MKSVWRAWFGLIVVMALAGCSSSHHHRGMMGEGKGDGYWQKGKEDVARLIDKTVKDPSKAQQAKAIADEIVAELKASREQDRASHRKIYELNANYQATPEDFIKVLDEASNNRMRSATKVLGLRFKMKELMTAEEWKAMSDEMAAYSARYQHGGSQSKGGY